MVDIEAPGPSPASSQRPSIELENLPLLKATPEDPLYQNHPASWHPKVTGFRLFVTSVTLGLGITKAITTVGSESTAAITIEWIAGAAVVLFCSICSIFESKDNPNPKWLFVVDYLDFVWRFFRLCTLPTPRYRTDERDTKVLIKPKRPRVTGYRLLVSFAVIGFGSVKAYQGHVAAPTTTDWVYCITTTLSLYWLGLYEASFTEVLPSLFEVDYSQPVVQGILLLVIIAIHLWGIVLASGWSAIWYRGIVDLWSSSPMDPEQPPLPALDRFSGHVFTLLWTAMAATIGMGPGIAGCGCLLFSLWWFIRPPIENIMGCIRPLFRGQAGHDDRDFTSWVLSCLLPLTDVFHHPTARIRRVFTALGMLVLAIGYVVVHGFALFVAFAWTWLWAYTLYVSWQEIPWYVYAFMFVAGIGATGAGTVGCIYVLVAFFSPLRGSYHPVFGWWQPFGTSPPTYTHLVSKASYLLRRFT